MTRFKFRIPGREKSEVYVKSELLTKKSPFNIAEAYKSMRTNLMFMLSGGKKTIAFTSAEASDGKTTTCLNTAIAFAQTGNKVLVVDMDMRKPRVHRYFDIPAAPGLSDMLGGFVEDIPIFGTEYENLFVLPVGTVPPNPSELLMSETFAALLAALRGDYDYIFFDAPPVSVVTDVAVVASKLDGIVFVVREKKTVLETVKQSVRSLERVDAKVLGFILNDSSGEGLFAQSRYGRRYNDRYSYRYDLPSEE